MGWHNLINEVIDWHDGVRGTLSGTAMIQAIEEKRDNEPDEIKHWCLNSLLAEEHEAQGNHAKAQEIYRRDPHYQIDHWHHELVLANRGRKITPMIQKRMEEKSEFWRLRHLRKLLAMEHTSEGNFAAAEAIRRQEFDEDPDDPTPLIHLAEQKLYYEDQADVAMTIIDSALEAAYRSGLHRRHALGVKARIALHLERHDIVENVLRDILQLKFTRKNFDVGRERDILDRLPPGSIDGEVARQYDEFCRAKKTSPSGG
jgi:tetratricopeptide (TPR) repeat protein